MSLGETLLVAFESLIVVYTLGYFACHLILLAAGFHNVRRRVRSLGFEDLDLMDGATGALPTVAVLVPAYNEATVIADAVRALTELDYPGLEIVVINDGSSDDTKRVMRSAFKMRRRDIAIRQDLETQPIRAIYEATVDMPAGVKRLVLVDKQNGGKADSLNAGINVSISPFFISIDADSILDPAALKQIIRVFQEQPDTIAAGGQVGIVNACTVEDGQIVRRSVPSNYVPLCQTVEYIRSFSIARTGFSQMNALIILSGAFMVMTREAAIQVGGFLTGRSESRLLHEYVGEGMSTICEDMEIIVRLHRWAKEMGREARVVHTPMPVCWTELPEDLTSLSKQRRRWHRGLIEILRYNRRMFMNPDYGSVGLLAMPYFIYFELLGPKIELLGLILLPLLAISGLMDPVRAGLILGLAFGAGMMQSILAVMAATWLEPVSATGHQRRSMMGTDSWRDRGLLLWGCLLSEFGYRQMTLVWRLRAAWDFLRGHKGWDKFERRGFKKVTTAALAFLLVTATPALGAERTVQMHLGQDAQHDGIHGWWGEVFGHWQWPKGSLHAGLYRVERFREPDHGILVGASRRWSWAGSGLEVRLAPSATVSPHTQARWDLEAPVGWSTSVTAHVGISSHETSRVWAMGPGFVWYRGDLWWSGRGLVWSTEFEDDSSDRLLGWDSRISVPWGAREIRATAGWGGESYWAGPQRDVGQVRAGFAGVELRQPLGNRWTGIVGMTHRRPDRGNANLYLQLGMIRGW